MFIPYNVDVPLARLPIANWVVIGLTCLVFVGQMAGWEGLDESVLVLFRDERFRPVQLVGSIVGHADVLHIVGNMLALFVFGNAVNAKLGQVYFLLAYVLIGVLDGLAWLAIGTGEGTLGASGAIMGIIGAFLVYFPRNNVSIFYWFYWRIGSFEVSAYWVIGAYVGLDLVGLAWDGEGGVNYLAHVVGALAGLGIAMALLTTGLVTSDSDEQNLIEAWRASGGWGAGKRARKKGARGDGGAVKEEWQAVDLGRAMPYVPDPPARPRPPGR